MGNKDLPLASGERCIRAMCRLGWGIEPKAGKGSHTILVKGVQRVSVPAHKELKRGTLAAILDQAGISHDEYLRAFR